MAMVVAWSKTVTPFSEPAYALRRSQAESDERERGEYLHAARCEVLGWPVFSVEAVGVLQGDDRAFDCLAGHGRDRLLEGPDADDGAEKEAQESANTVICGVFCSSALLQGGPEERQYCIL